jgi:two-component system, NarL family, response regulator NreC
MADVIKVLIADDHDIVLEGLRFMINAQEDMRVVGEAKDGRTSVKLAQQLHPDIVIMDVSMPDLNGMEATREIKAKAPGVRVLALSAHSNRKFVTNILEAGASGYLLKNDATEKLINAIRHVASDQSYLSPSIAKIVVESYVQTNPEREGQHVLSTREREVLQLLAEGKSVKQIASFLHISVKTAETHSRNIKLKLDIHNTSELIRWALREGVITLEGA